MRRHGEWVPILVLGLCGGCGSRALQPSDDGGTTARDSGSGGDRATDAGAPAPGCSAFARYQGGQLLSERHPREVLFSRTLDRVIVSFDEERASSGVGSLVSYALPSGQEELLLGEGMREIAWLDQERAVLGRMNSEKAVPQRYELVVCHLEQSLCELYGPRLCGHAVAPGGERLYIVRDCDDDDLGTLEQVDRRADTKTVLGQRVVSSSVVVARDGSRIAFVGDAAKAEGCGVSVGSAVIVTQAGARHDVPLKAVGSSLGLLPSGALLLAEFSGCDGWGPMWVSDPASDSLVQLPDLAGYGSYDGEYPASPDSRFVVGYDQPATIEGPYDLYAVRTDGSGMTRIADDLFPFGIVSKGFRVFSVTASGQRVVYTSVGEGGYPKMGLAAVSVDGGEPLTLTGALYDTTYVDAPGRDEVALLEEGVGIRRVDVTTGTGHTVFSSGPERIVELSYVPRDRGLLFVTHLQREGSTSTLRHVRQSGGEPTTLGQWSQSSLWPWTAGPTRYYRVDPSGCLVLFDSDEGTVLAQIPE